ncbi:hypothetical protein [Chryseobacterium sp. EO14]|uniref:hypothetical protein n=1 Tax=Chryseobacterium sp. EO14 TaxID=2950551 RepID=UPI00210C0D34|nr:hypothetical protein [Chryseobacterium sp. EO14]MCQ4141618.1 hypothetical protein [Chryseobacterium sp. EO14]
MNIYLFFPVSSIISFTIGFVTALLYYEFLKKTISGFLILIFALMIAIAFAVVSIQIAEVDNSESSSVAFIFSIIQVVPFYLGAMYVNRRKNKK